MAEKKAEAKKASGPGRASGRKKISVKKKAKKTFYVPNSTGKRRMKSVKPRWRKPRGIDNKKRIRKAFAGKCPRVGNKNTGAVRGLHPLGLPEIIVGNLKDLEGADGVLVRVASKVGKRKKAEIVAKAKGMNIRILNEGVNK
jgi:large subunit ribosomal protein L32e